MFASGNMYTREDGELAIRIARDALDSAVRQTRFELADVPEKFTRRSGAFVTLSTFPSHNLRGCIGYPEPIFPLAETIVKAAASAALHDPRFPPVAPDELEELVVEVSLLTPPEEILVKKPKEYIKEVVVGRDGLILELGRYKGLLLPQVPIEYGWSVKEFLAHTCGKAGLPPDAWLNDNVRIFRFSAVIFHEKKPRGAVSEKKISDKNGCRS